MIAFFLVWWESSRPRRPAATSFPTTAYLSPRPKLHTLVDGTGESLQGGAGASYPAVFRLRLGEAAAPPNPMGRPRPLGKYTNWETELSSASLASTLVHWECMSREGKDSRREEKADVEVASKPTQQDPGLLGLLHQRFGNRVIADALARPTLSERMMRTIQPSRNVVDWRNGTAFVNSGHTPAEEFTAFAEWAKARLSAHGAATDPEVTKAILAEILDAYAHLTPETRKKVDSEPADSLLSHVHTYWVLSKMP